MNPKYIASVESHDYDTDKENKTTIINCCNSIYRVKGDYKSILLALRSNLDFIIA